jgi:hypothetical protein
MSPCWSSRLLTTRLTDPSQSWARMKCTSARTSGTYAAESFLAPKSEPQPAHKIALRWGDNEFAGNVMSRSYGFEAECVRGRCDATHLMGPTATPHDLLLAILKGGAMGHKRVIFSKKHLFDGLRRAGVERHDRGTGCSAYGPG